MPSRRFSQAGPCSKPAWICATASPPGVSVTTSASPPFSSLRWARYWKKRGGVCQDFAHLTIACLRSLGLPARYVSVPTCAAAIPLHRHEASHAWVLPLLSPVSDVLFLILLTTLCRRQPRDPRRWPRLLRCDAGQRRGHWRQRPDRERRRGRSCRSGNLMQLCSDIWHWPAHHESIFLGKASWPLRPSAF